jgi:hypothetical protein
MSGYLQRMVSNAQKPARSIHPILGSLYSAPKYGAPPEAFQAEEDLVSSVRPEPGRKTAPEAAPVLTRAIVPTPETLRRDEDPKKGTEARTSLESLVAPRQKAATPLEPNETPSEWESVKLVEPHAGAPEREVAPRYPYQPLVEEADHPASAERTFGDSAPRATGATRGPRRDPPPRVAQPGREPDEIEIHIGRIEVTAVPQVAVRPAAQPARKSLNLDEYLKRRNRRA